MTVPCSESPLEGEVKVLCSPQEQLLGLGVLGAHLRGVAREGALGCSLERAVVGSEQDLLPPLSSRGQDGLRPGSCN